MNRIEQPFSPEKESKIRFLHSRTAMQTLATFLEHDLPLSRTLLHRFQEKKDLEYGGFNPRYGNGFSSISRFCTNLLVRYNKPEERIMQIFSEVPELDHDCQEMKDQENYSRILTNKVTKHIQSKLETITTNKLTAPAKYLVELIPLWGGAPPPPHDTPFMELWADSISPRHGSCKDAEAYFTNALGFPNGELYGERKLSIIKFNQSQPILLQKLAYGAESALTMQPITLNGVNFPTGMLVRAKIIDNGILHIRPLRATAFSFDTEEMIDAFGSQAFETENVTAGKAHSTHESFFKLHAKGWKTTATNLFQT